MTEIVIRPKSFKEKLHEFWVSVKPKSKRKWIRLIWDITEMIVFLYAIFNSSWFYRQGYLDGVKAGIVRGLNITVTNGFGQVLYQGLQNVSNNSTVNITDLLKVLNQTVNTTN